MGLRSRLALTSQDKRETRWLRNLLVGAAVGVVMTAATYVAYPLAALAVPSLVPRVAQLYASAQVEHAAIAIAWTCMAIVAEELLFRGLLLEGLRSVGASRLMAGGISLACYLLVQIGSGSGIIALTAFVCGACWTVERIFTKSLTAAVVSHFIWTIVVIHLYPVTHGA
jgi:membrane protease YdiL (CAAX protease family)